MKRKTRFTMALACLPLLLAGYSSRSMSADLDIESLENLAQQEDDFDIETLDSLTQAGDDFDIETLDNMAQQGQNVPVSTDVSVGLGDIENLVDAEKADAGEEPADIEEPAAAEDPMNIEEPADTEEPAAAEDPINTEAPADTELPADAEEHHVTAADYYQFLKAEYAKEEQEALKHSYLLAYKPATTEPVELRIQEGDFMDNLSWNVDLYGTISAVVEDFDADGGLEMLEIGIEDVAVMNTRLGSVLYEDGADYDSQNRCFELTLRYYDEKDGAVTRVESHCIPFAMMPMDGWGHILVGMEKLDDKYELYAYVYSENMSTYGPNYLEVINIPGNAPKYITAVQAFGLSEAEANAVLYVDNVWDIASTTLYDTYQTILQVDGAQSNLDPTEEAYRDALGNGLLCFVNVAYPEWGGNKAVYTLTDYTNYQHYLDNDAADWAAIDIPQGGERKGPEAPAGLEQFIADVASAANVTFTAKGDTEENGVITSTQATDNNHLTVQWDTAQNIPVSVGWYANDSNTTEEWFTVKDVILSNPVFGWADGETDMLKGEVSWNDYAGNITIGDYSCGIANVVGASMNIVRAEG